MITVNKKAFSVVEYVMLFVIVMGAFLVMRQYIQNGLQGNWGKTGQAFAYGRQYDPQKTVECDFDEQLNLWYDHNCAQAQCKGDMDCIQSAVASCQTVSCNIAKN